MIEDIVNNYKKSIDALNDSSKVLESAIVEAKSKAKDKDKAVLQNLESDMKQLISVAKSGGNIDSMIKSIKKNYGYKDK